MCRKKLSCGYYDNNSLKNRLETSIHATYVAHRIHCSSYTLLSDHCRYIGLQVGYKIMGIFLLMMLGWKAQRTQEYSLEKQLEGPL